MILVCKKRHLELSMCSKLFAMLCGYIYMLTLNYCMNRSEDLYSNTKGEHLLRHTFAKGRCLVVGFCPKWLMDMVSRIQSCMVIIT